MVLLTSDGFGSATQYAGSIAGVPDIYGANAPGGTSYGTGAPAAAPAPSRIYDGNGYHSDDGGASWQDDWGNQWQDTPSMPPAPAQPAYGNFLPLGDAMNNGSVPEAQPSYFQPQASWQPGANGNFDLGNSYTQPQEYSQPQFDLGQGAAYGNELDAWRNLLSDPVTTAELNNGLPIGSTRNDIWAEQTNLANELAYQGIGANPDQAAQYGFRLDPTNPGHYIQAGTTSWQDAALNGLTAANTSLIPPGVLDYLGSLGYKGHSLDNLNVDLGPFGDTRQFLEGATSPVGLATLGLGGGAAGLVENPLLKILAGAGEGALFNGGLTGAEQALSGNYDLGQFLTSLGTGAALGGAIPAIHEAIPLARETYGLAREHAPAVTDAIGRATEKAASYLMPEGAFPGLGISTEGINSFGNHSGSGRFPEGAIVIDKDGNAYVNLGGGGSHDEFGVSVRPLEGGDVLTIRGGDLHQAVEPPPPLVPGEPDHIGPARTRWEQNAAADAAAIERSRAKMQAPPESPAASTPEPRTLAEQPPREPPAGLNPGGPGDKPPSQLLAEGDPWETAKAKILDYAKAETKLRTSGVAESEIKAGRRTQFENIRQSLEAQGLSPEDAAAQARRSAAVGQLRETVAAPLELSPAEKSAVIDNTLQGIRDGRVGPEEIFRVTGANSTLDKMLTPGVGLQPAELKWVAKTFGDDVAAALAERPKLPSIVAHVTEEDILRQPGLTPGVRRLEAEAEAQHKLATDLEGRARMNPTNPRLQKLAEDARARAFAKANAADEAERLASQRAVDIAQQKAERSAQAEATAENRRQLADALKRDRVNPNDRDILAKAKRLIGQEENVSEPLNRQAALAMENWLKDNRAVLDSMGETRFAIGQRIKATLTGDLADSYLTALETRKGMLRAALEATGETPEIAKKVADTLADYELKRRYPGGTPERLTAELAKTKLDYNSGVDTVARGFAATSQAFKNTMFGPLDIGVFGQQFLHAIGTAGPNMLAGIVNRSAAALHLPHVDTMMADLGLERAVRMELDGIPQHGASGFVKPEAGTLLRHVPGFGKVGEFHGRAMGIDPAVSWWIGKLSDLQFGLIMGKARNLAYEGNLVLAHVARQDIRDPKVRADAREAALSATSSSRRALNATRATFEEGTLLSPTMRRAQAAQIIQVAKVFSPRASATERLLGATTILTAAGTTLLVGKLLNDYIGTGPFEFDPSKPGFGQITIPGGPNGKNQVISLFPQTQVVKAIATSVRELAEADPQAAAQAWGKLFLSSASPVASTAAKAAGFGYDPNSGYRFGDFGSGMSVPSRLINLAPIPPIVQSFVNGEIPVPDSAVSFLQNLPATGENLLGLNAYTESDYAAQNRVAQQLYGKDYYQLPKYPVPGQNGSQQEVDAANGGKLASTNPVTLQRQAAQAKLDAQNTAVQQQIDTLPPGTDWRDAYHNLQAQKQGQYDALTQAFPYTGPESTEPQNVALNEWSQVIKDNTFATKTDWDAVDAWMAANPDKAVLVNAYLTGSADDKIASGKQSATVTQYKNDSKAIADSGYFDLRDKAWQAVVERYPSLTQYGNDWDAVQKAGIQTLFDQYRAASPATASDAEVLARATRDFAKTNVAKDMTQAAKYYRDQWAQANPDAASLALEWGYYTPTDEILSWLASQ